MENFENEFCNFLGLPPGSAVAVSSGTAALYLTLVMLEAKEFLIVLLVIRFPHFYGQK